MVYLVKLDEVLCIYMVFVWILKGKQELFVSKPYANV